MYSLQTDVRIYTQPVIPQLVGPSRDSGTVYVACKSGWGGQGLRLAGRLISDLQRLPLHRASTFLILPRLPVNLSLGELSSRFRPRRLLVHRCELENPAPPEIPSVGWSSPDSGLLGNVSHSACVFAQALHFSLHSVDLRA